MHISQKLQDALSSGKPAFSFEFFPPKTTQGVQNLYDRMDRMHDLGPAFIDITWGAGGRLATLTCEMVKTAQSVYGLEVCMHLTCTDMGKEKIDEALKEAYKAGCTNILALRGDPPRDQEEWKATEGGFRYAKDLVEYIKKEYGDHFDIGVAGYPEGSDDEQDPEVLMQHLKAKVDAGGTFIVTQMFYDADLFLDWVNRVRAAGVTVPIVPGIMPIQTYAAFIRRANWSKCHVPAEWHEKLNPIKNDDAQVREVGKTLVAEMCRKILDAGIPHLHFYTMNLQQATKITLEELNLIDSTATQKALPWRQSKGLNRRDEDVRPIFWRNRAQSYISRTQDWDEFPNGRWGDARSPAFGHLDAYNIGLRGTNEQNIKLWGSPTTIREVSDVFVQFLDGKISSLPWSESGLAGEASAIHDELVSLNRRGFLTINSQPSVNGVKSTDQVFGWGPSGGYCYQKAYLEFLIPPEYLEKIIPRIDADLNLTYFAVNKAGDLKANTGEEPNAVTWGVFPGKEIVQPTIVEKISFLAWKDEAFRLGEDWARCHPVESDTRHLISAIMENWYLVNIVNNDFQSTEGIFRLFDGMELADLDKKSGLVAGSNHVNGDSEALKTDSEHTAEGGSTSAADAVPAQADSKLTNGH